MGGQAPSPAGFDLQLCVVTCSHLPGKRAPHTFFPLSAAAPNVQARLSHVYSTESNHHRATLSPISRTRVHQAGTSRDVLGCDWRYALLGHSVESLGGRAMSFTRSAVAQCEEASSIFGAAARSSCLRAIAPAQHTRHRLDARTCCLHSRDTRHSCSPTLPSPSRAPSELLSRSLSAPPASPLRSTTLQQEGCAPAIALALLPILSLQHFCSNSTLPQPHCRRQPFRLPTTLHSRRRKHPLHQAHLTQSSRRHLFSSSNIWSYLDQRQ